MNSKLRHFYLSEKNSPIKKLSVIIFVAGIAYALASSVWSIYIRSFLDSDARVGLTTSFLVLVAFVSYFVIIPLIESSNKYKLTLKFSLFAVLGFILYAITKNFYLFLIFASAMAIFGAVRSSAFGLLIRGNSTRKNISKDEGLIFIFNNTSFLIGPFIATLILLKLGIRSVFLISAFILFISILMLRYSKINEGKKIKTTDKKLLENFKGFFENKERVKSYIFALGVNFWWSLIYIYIPLLIIKSLDDFWVGIFLGLVTIPLILGEYKSGKIADKKGYKNLFFLGFLIPAIITLLCFFFYNNIFFIIISLTFASVGLAMVESNSEAYFFKVSNDKEEQRYYSPFKTSIETGHFLGQMLPAVILFFLPFKFIFLFFFAGMLILSFLALSIRKAPEEKRKSTFLKNTH